MHELRVECADMVLRESNLQSDSQPGEIKSGSIRNELEERDRALQETRMRTLQEMEELKKICCTEAEKTQQFEDRGTFLTREAKSICSESVHGSESGIAR